MRRFIAILVIIMTTTVGAHAQSIRLGESIPSISVSPSIDETLDLYNRDYTCLIFAHSESKPCVDAMRAFEATAHEINRTCAIVVITGEDESNSEAIIERLDIEDYIVAFDNENRTLKNFGINYVPFAVIYRTKNSRIEWFGPLHHINSKLIKDISKR
jgi:hypothetical protein